MRLASLSVGVLVSFLVPVSVVAPATASSGLVGETVVVLNGGGVESAKVKAVVWPNSATLAALPVGANVPLLEGSVSVQNAGEFLVDTSSLPLTYVEVDGTRSVEMSFDDGVTKVVDSRILGASSKVKYSVGTGVGGARFSRVSSADTEVRLKIGVPAPVCAWQKQSTTKQTNAYYVRARTTPTAPVSVHQKRTNTQSFGIGIKVENGPWKAGGTSSLTMTGDSSATTANFTASREYANSVVYRLYHYKCVGGGVAKQEWRVESLFDMNTTHRTLAQVIYSYCGFHNVGDSWTKSSGTAWKNEAGVDIGVVSLSATAEWGRDVTLSYGPATRYAAYCGNTSAGPLSSPLTEVHAGA